VELLSRGTPTQGTLHLTAHHLIFSSQTAEDENPREMWVCYPIIHTVERRQPLGLGVEGCALRFRCRDFNFFTLTFRNEQDGKEVFESVQRLTCVGKFDSESTLLIVASVNQLYAFFYQPGKAEKKFNAWKIYEPEKEFARMGLGTRTHEWRITHINKDYSVLKVCSTLMIVVLKLSSYIRCADEDLG
jgi:myotubularin-related protein 6/7/8